MKNPLFLIVLLTQPLLVQAFEFGWICDILCAWFGGFCPFYRFGAGGGAQGMDAFHGFGVSVGMSANGNAVIGGGYADHVGQPGEVGLAKVYSRTATGSWEHKGEPDSSSQLRQFSGSDFSLFDT